MAEIATEAGVRADEPFLLGASQLSLYLWDEAWLQAPQVLAGDAQALHDMRVALRRLRSCLENYQHPDARAWLEGKIIREIKTQRAKLGKFGDALGAVRDFDVLDEYLRVYVRQRLKSDLEAQQDLQRFDEYLQQQRAQNFAAMTRRLERAARPNKFHAKFRRWAASLAGVAGLRTQEIDLRSAAKVILTQRIDDALALGSMLHTADENGQHELRKSLRRLRYTLEAFAPAFGKVKSPVKTLVEMQDALGEMQDRSVLHAMLLQAFTAKTPHELPDAAQKFAAFGVYRRRYLLGRMRRLWQQAQTENFWEQLRRL